MNLKIARVGASIVFEFGDRAAPVSSLIVADANEVVLWEIESGPALVALPVVENRFTAVQAPFDIAELWGKALPEDNADRYCRAMQIIYGELPEGFREIEPAVDLTRGRLYCVTIFGAGLDSAGQFFTA